MIIRQQFIVCVMQLRSGEDPELRNTPKMPPTEEAGLLTDLTIPHSLAFCLAITVRNLVMATRHSSHSREPIWAAQQQPMKWVRSCFHPEATKLAIWSIRLSLRVPRRCFRDPRVEDWPLHCLP